MFFADVIFASAAPYTMWFWFFPITALALISEMLVFHYTYRRLPTFSIIAASLGANAASWLLGIIICGLFLPNGLVRKQVSGGSSAQTYLTAGPNFVACLTLAFFIALLLSIIIEWGVWRMIYRKAPLNVLGKTSAIANGASYAIFGFFYFNAWM